MTLRALSNHIVFQFLDPNVNGMFVDRNAGKIITGVSIDTQGKECRWAKVIALGPDITSIQPDDFILIEPLRWTKSIRFEEQQLWRTDESAILAITKNYQDTFGTF